MVPPPQAELARISTWIRQNMAGHKWPGMSRCLLSVVGECYCLMSPKLFH